MFETLAFYTFAGLTTAMFMITITSKNALYAMTSLAAGMIFISGFFFLLNADFLGVVQIVVYTGAVMALYAFGMMFFDVTRDVKESIISPKSVGFLSVSAALLMTFILSAPIAISRHTDHPIINDIDNPQNIGVVLFTKYLIPFEVASIMLLVAMVAGIILASKRMDISLTTTIEDDMKLEAGKEI